MLFDIGWPELLLTGMIALVVIGPKDLPRALRVAGIWVRKARTLSREFQSSIDQMIREAELDEVRQDLKKVTEFDLEREFQSTVDPTGELAHSIKPPDLPDHFEEPGTALPAATPTATSAGTPEVPALPAPTESALPGPATSVASVPEPIAAPVPDPGRDPEPAAKP
ncbi:MAG TPA: Sec-independent protein translocase protein TatB [Stellaceae bacterium]|nr:Sec-independent protein translocase protein TatB [Stellaceae bacterium]